MKGNNIAKLEAKKGSGCQVAVLAPLISTSFQKMAKRSLAKGFAYAGSWTLYPTHPPEMFWGQTPPMLPGRQMTPGGFWDPAPVGSLETKISNSARSDPFE